MLYKFRDHYFENHSLEDAINRNSDTKKELDKVLEMFKEFEGVVLCGSSIQFINMLRLQKLM